MKQPIAIPNKLYFRIGEVADLLTVKPYVLRYWETEFPDIRPAKSKSGQRLYKRRDVELLVRIRELLYGERFTINGARKRLKELMRQAHASDQIPQMPLELTEEKKIPAPVIQKSTSAPVSKVSKTIASSGDQHKVFTKIKKDLEQILSSLRA